MAEIEQIQQTFKTDLSSGMTPDELRIKYLGRKGVVAQVFKQIKNVPAEEKATFGQAVNALKAEIEQVLKPTRTEQTGTSLNLVPPALDQLQAEVGHISPVSAMIFRIQDIMEKMGFSVASGPELEVEHYNFDVLNIPDNHPARDVWDTIWVNSEDGQKRLLRTHTSPGQVRYMESHEAPIRIILPGKVYRYEATDATHETSFHQVEGLMVDATTSIATFKGVMQELFSQLFRDEVEVRLRPSYFPFTEPSFELDVKFQGTWLEVGGAGMVNRKVLKAGGITDPNLQGFAFGIGVERMVMILTGLNDIRHIHASDMRFAYQMGVKRTK